MGKDAKYTRSQREAVYKLCLKRVIKEFQYLGTLSDKTIVVKVKTNKGVSKKYRISKEGKMVRET